MRLGVLALVFLMILPQASAEDSLEAPTGLRAEADVQNDTVTLTWNPSSGADSYRVYREGIAVGEVSATRYVEPLPVNLTVNYTVTALANGQESSPSSEIYMINVRGPVCEWVSIATYPNPIQPPPYVAVHHDECASKLIVAIEDILEDLPLAQLGGSIGTVIDDALDQSPAPLRPRI